MCRRLQVFPVVPIDSQDDCQDCALGLDNQYDAAPCTGLTASDCQNCPTNRPLHSASPADPNIGITSCSCDADNYGTRGGTCTAYSVDKIRPAGRVEGETLITKCLCPEGHYHVNDSSCAECHKTDIRNATACTACRNHSVSGIGSTQEIQCDCEPGWYLSNGFCVECLAGFIKPNVSISVCTACPPDTFMPDANCAASACLPCASNVIRMSLHTVGLATLNVPVWWGRWPRPSWA